MRLRGFNPIAQSQTRLSPSQVGALCESYRSGASLRDLEVEFGVHRDTALRHLKIHGIDRRPATRKLNDIQVTEAAKLYGRGLSLRRVGDEFGVGTTTIRREFRQAGVKIRPR
jgi:hypothetical protein